MENKIPNKSFNLEQVIFGEPVTVKLKPQGVIRNFSFVELLDLAMRHFTDRGMPFAYSICVSNNERETIYHNVCNQDKLDIALTDDWFLKDCLSDRPGNKKKNFNHGKPADYMSGSIAIKAMDGFNEKCSIRRLLDIIEQHVIIYDIPFFYLLCIENNPDKTEYFGNCLYSGVRYKLTDNRFRQYALVALGFDPYETPVKAIDMSMDDMPDVAFDEEEEEE